MRTPALLTAAAITACGYASTEPVTDSSGTEPTSELRACAATTDLVRCTREDGLALSAAVCGDLVTEAALRVTGVLAVGGEVAASAPLDVGGPANGPGVVACDRAPDARLLADRALALGANDGEAHLANVSQPSTIDLDCGTYRFASLGLRGPRASLLLRIHGDTVLVVEGDVRVAAPMQVVVASGARLDVVVTGDFEADDTVTFRGGETWLAVGGRLHVRAPFTLDGWLLGDGEIVADDTLTVDGAVFAASLRVGAPMSVTGAHAVTPDGCVAR